MSNSKFERTPTTRTDTLLVSDRRVMEQFAYAVEKALEAVEEAVTFAGAVSDNELSIALIRLEQIQAAVDRGHAIIQARLNDKPIAEFEADQFGMMDEFSEMSSAVDDYPPIPEQDEPNDDLLTVSQASARLGLPKDDVIIMMNEGKLKAVASNGQIMLHTDDVEALRNNASRLKSRQESQSAIEVEKSGASALAPSSSPEEVDDFDDILDRLFDGVGKD